MIVLSESRGAVFAASLGSIFLLLLFVALYFIPTIVAGLRHVPNVGSVAVVNVFLGWTFIGWVVALAMACRSGDRNTVVNVQQLGGQQQHWPAQQQQQHWPPGWYPDPSGGEWVVYWDGARWTEQRAPRQR